MSTETTPITKLIVLERLPVLRSHEMIIDQMPDLRGLTSSWAKQNAAPWSPWDEINADLETIDSLEDPGARELLQRLVEYINHPRDKTRVAVLNAKQGNESWADLYVALSYALFHEDTMIPLLLEFAPSYMEELLNIYDYVIQEALFGRFQLGLLNRNIIIRSCKNPRAVRWLLAQLDGKYDLDDIKYNMPIALERWKRGEKNRHLFHELLRVENNNEILKTFFDTAVIGPNGDDRLYYLAHAIEWSIPQILPTILYAIEKLIPIDSEGVLGILRDHLADGLFNADVMIEIVHLLATHGLAEDLCVPEDDEEDNQRFEWMLYSGTPELLTLLVSYGFEDYPENFSYVDHVDDNPIIIDPLRYLIEKNRSDFYSYYFTRYADRARSLLYNLMTEEQPDDESQDKEMLTILVQNVPFSHREIMTAVSRSIRPSLTKICLRHLGIAFDK